MVTENSNPPIIDDKDRAEQAFDQVYNQAVDHCIRIIELGRDNMELIGETPAVSLLESLIEKLEDLKKP